MEIEDLKNMRVIVSPEEWDKLDPEQKLDLIALSRMTGEDTENNLNEDEKKLYCKLMYN